MISTVRNLILTACIMTAVVYGQLIAVLCIGVVCLFFLLRNRVSTANGYTTVRGHTHDGPIRQVSIHEGGHCAAAKHVGGRVIDARVTGNSRQASGYTLCTIPNDPASQVGVYLAGFAAAPDTGSPTDQDMVDKVLTGVPSPYRGYILREGREIARKAGKSSDVRYYADRLEQQGRL